MNVRSGEHFDTITKDDSDAATKVSISHGINAHHSPPDEAVGSCFPGSSTETFAPRLCAEPADMHAGAVIAFSKYRFRLSRK